MERSELGVTFSYSSDHTTWGLRNNYEYEWDLDSPLLHQLGVPERKFIGTRIDLDEPFEPLLRVRENVWSSVICKDESERPRVSARVWFKIRLYHGDEMIAEVNEIMCDGVTTYRFAGAISKVTFTEFGLDSVSIDTTFRKC